MASWPVALQAPLSMKFSGQKPTGVGCHSFLQGIFLTQGSNLGLQHCGQILYHLSHQGSPTRPQGKSYKLTFVHINSFNSIKSVLPGGTSGTQPFCQCRRYKRSRFRQIPWKRAWQPTAVFLPGESHGQRSLVGYSPWSHKWSDTTE